MRKILLSVVLWLGWTLVVQAQLAAPPAPIPIDTHHIFADELYRWWWGYTPQQVYDKVLSEPGWKITGPEEDGSHDPDFKIMSAAYTKSVSMPDAAFLLFTFFKGQLVRRAYSLQESNPLVKVWNDQLTQWAYDEQNSRWIDAYHHAEIKRRHYEGLIMYDVTPYYEDTKK